MIVKCGPGPALRLICLLAILCACDSGHALSLPLSDLTPSYAMTPEISEKTQLKKKMFNFIRGGIMISEQLFVLMIIVIVMLI